MSRHHSPQGVGRHGESAGHYLVGAVPRAQPGDTAAAARAMLSGCPYDAVELICITDELGKLVGILPVAELMALPEAVTLGEAMYRDPPAVKVDEDQERAASIALHHVINAVPVVDHHGHLLGVVPPAALLHILRREHVEDLHRLAGIGRETARAREAIESPPFRRARHRLPWLLQQIGTDPAYGSGPLATIIQDVLRACEKIPLWERACPRHFNAIM